jgi:IS5 family transposase
VHRQGQGQRALRVRRQGFDRTTNARAPGGQFVLHAKALPGNPYDGHTLRDVIEDTQKLTGCEIERGYVDKGYRGHDAQNPRRVFISGQKRGVFGTIKRELRRRSAIEPVIGHLKAEGHLGRCYLKGRAGDAANAILSAVGYNFRRILAWLRAFLRIFLIEIAASSSSDQRSISLVNGRQIKCRPQCHAALFDDCWKK